MSTIRTTSKITEVTVFESSAQLRRVATIDKMPKGEVSVLFTDLPTNIDRDNVQVSIRHDGEDETGGCSLRGVAFKTETTTIAEEAPTEERKALAEKVKNLREQIEDLRADIDAARERRDFFQNCADSALKGDRPDEEAASAFKSPDAWKQMLDTTAAQDAAGLEQQRKLEKQVKELQKEFEVAQRELNSMGGGARTVTKQVVAVVLKVEKAIENIDVRISYVASAASWSAEYDVRYDADKNEATVIYNAVITQTGSESWDNVSLTVSTARPTISGRPKDLTPWHAKVYVPPRAVHDVRRAGRAMACAAPMSMSRSRNAAPVAMGGIDLDDDEDSEECCKEAEDIDLSGYEAPQIEVAKVTEGATAMSFNLEHAKTVGNNGKSVKVTLTTVPVSTSITYLARPKLNELVFARMKAVNISSFTLLPGPAAVFSGQQFICKTNLERVAPGSDFRCPLGVDNDITVKYRKLKKERTESGGGIMSSKKTKYNVHNQIKVNNRKKIAVDITVEDQIPLSQHSDIEVVPIRPVKPEDESSDLYRKFVHEGRVVFECKLAAQEEKALDIEFTVKHPDGFDMEGL